MTDEKMAEEYAEDYFRLYCPQDEELRAVKQDFLAGLKARPQWHDLEKDPTDLPKNCKNDFLLCFRGGTHYGVVFFNGLRFICYGGDYDDVIKWCEIPIFDKE